MAGSFLLHGRPPPATLLRPAALSSPSSSPSLHLLRHQLRPTTTRPFLHAHVAISLDHTLSPRPPPSPARSTTPSPTIPLPPSSPRRHGTTITMASLLIISILSPPPSMSQPSADSVSSSSTGTPPSPLTARPLPPLPYPDPRPSSPPSPLRPRPRSEANASHSNLTAAASGFHHPTPSIPHIISLPRLHLTEVHPPPSPPQPSLDPLHHQRGLLHHPSPLLSSNRSVRCHLCLSGSSSPAPFCSRLSAPSLHRLM